MRLTLIKPNIGRKGHSLYVDEGRMEPLQLGVLAGLTPPEVEVVFFDDRMEKIDYGLQTDLVAITVETFTARRSYEIAAEYRKRGVKVILGGMHAMLAPEEVKEHADSIYIGDAEYLWSQVLEDADSGKLKPVYTGGTEMPQPGGIVARRDIFNGKGYLPITLLQFSRGCNFGCVFCATSKYFDKRHTCRNIQDVITEIKSQGRKLLFFVDDNIVGNPHMAKELFRELIPLKIKWVSQGSINMTGDSELMELMVQSGCLGHVIGFESIQQKNMVWAGKQPNSMLTTYDEAIAKLRYYGLQTWAAFTLGYDYDTEDSIIRTYEFAYKNKFAFAAFNILMPYPDTQFYKFLESEGRLLYDGKWWIHPEYKFNYASFIPMNMSPDRLTEISFDCRKDFNSLTSIISRAFDFKTNMRNLTRLGVYLAYNPVFRKEVFKKQGLKFGIEK